MEQSTDGNSGPNGTVSVSWCRGTPKTKDGDGAADSNSRFRVLCEEAYGCVCVKVSEGPMSGATAVQQRLSSYQAQAETGRRQAGWQLG